MKTQVDNALLLRLGALVVAGIALVACGDDGDPLAGGARTNAPGGPNDPGGASSSGGPTDPAQCTPGRAFTGMGGENLVKRTVANAGVDRGRFKPYSALAGEFQRVLGNTPASLAGAADTYGKPDARWYDEPSVGSVVLQKTYSVAYDGCLTYTATAPEYASAPDAATATAQCAAMTRKFWSRTASPDAIAACADVAVSGTATVAEPRKRWAYACASVLTSAGFLTY